MNYYIELYLIFNICKSFFLFRTHKSKKLPKHLEFYFIFHTFAANKVEYISTTRNKTKIFFAYILSHKSEALFPSLRQV